MKSRTRLKHPFAFVLALLSILLGAISAQGQTTGFTYQGMSRANLSLLLGLTNRR